MRKVWLIKFALTALILNWASPASSAEQCHAVHRGPKVIFSNVVNQFVAQFAGKTDRRLDPNYFLATRTLVHRTTISFATDPDLKSHTNEFRARLEEMVSERRLAENHRSDDYLRLLEDMVSYLNLNQSSLDEWKSYLLGTHPKIRVQSGTPTSLLGALPEITKASLLEWLGTEYAGPNKRKATAPIHKILDPKGLYQKFKKEGRSDREFYNEYLARVKKYAFRNQPEIGGYTGDMVIEIARAIQTYLKSKPDMQAINFLGSVPNGFGTPTSDLDIFNHADKNIYPELAKLQDHDSRGRGMPSPLEAMRYQIDDPALANLIQKVTGSTMWTWHLENHGNLAEEHLAAQYHLFSFHITKDKIELRFYDNYILWDPTTSDGFLHYVTLNID